MPDAPIPTSGPDVTPPVPGPTPPGDPTPPAFLDTLPEGLRGEKSLQSFKDVGGLAKSFVEAQKLIGGSIRVPAKDAKPEEWADVWTKLGRPPTPEGYAPTRPHLHESLPWDEGLEKDFLSVAHKAGLHPTQVQTVLDWYGHQMNTRFASASEGIAESLTTLQGEWGGAFNRNIALGQRVVKEYGGDALISVLNETGLGNHPVLIRFAAKLGQALAEEGIISGHLEGIPGPDEAKTKAQAIMADRKGPYWDVKNPLHEQTVQQVKELYEIAFPTIA